MPTARLGRREGSRIVREDVKLAPIDVGELVQEIIMVTPALQLGVVTVEGLQAVVARPP